MKQLYVTGILFFSLTWYSCSKTEKKPDAKPTGTVSFYNIELNVCDTVQVEVDGQKGIVTRQYSTATAACGKDGMLVLKLDTGKHRYTATCGSMKSEREFVVKQNECTLQGVGFYVNPSLDGIWTLDLKLETEGSPCDETLLEDEAHVPPTVSFRSGNVVWFETDPVDAGINGGDFKNTYDYQFPNLKISSTFNDGTDIMIFEAQLTYNSASRSFEGTYTNTWSNGLVCKNDVSLHR